MTETQLGSSKNEGRKIFRLWKFIEFSDAWRVADTSIVDDISASWFRRREVLKNGSREYDDFLQQLKREHAIETGIVERLYDLSRGVTETLIKKGFVESYVSHGDTDVPKTTLMNHLRDHLSAVDFVFDVVKNDRPLTVGFIKELHHLVTRHQSSAEGPDQFGNKTDILLLKGDWKKRENNPTREDGTVIAYCPPEHVDAEMDKLVEILGQLEAEKVHPIIISAWLHHAFTTIHPFQDGNGRVVRLLSSLVLVKHELFPFTVLREESRVKYIDGLEEADAGKPEKLVAFFCEVQRRAIEKALNIRVTVDSLEAAAELFSKKLDSKRAKDKSEQTTWNKLSFDSNRIKSLFFLTDITRSLSTRLSAKFEDEAEIDFYEPLSDNQNKLSKHFKDALSIFSQHHNYEFNQNLPYSILGFIFSIEGNYGFTFFPIIHHYGNDFSTLAITVISESSFDKSKRNILLDFPPHLISIVDDPEPKLKNLKTYLENALTLALAQIASEL